MKIQIMSFHELETTEFKEPTCVISISVDEHHPNLEKENIVDFLCLIFADRDSGPYLMTLDQAALVLWISNINKENNIICQCDSGISRSSGMAAALSLIYNKDDLWVFNNPKYRPNMHVYRTILKAAGLT
jgi:predicted protein tyrosine phosphatase